MALPIARHDHVHPQSPVSWLGLGAAGRPGWARWASDRVEVGYETLVVESGTRNPISTLKGFSLPLGYLHDFKVYAYYDMLSGGSPDIDDDGWSFSFEVASSNDRITLSDGQEYSRIEDDEAAWVPAHFAYPGAELANNQSSTVEGQPTDGSGIQSLSFAQVGGYLTRPLSMGGFAPYEWVRVSIDCATPGDRKSLVVFTIRYFANRWTWDRVENPWELDELYLMDPAGPKKYEPKQNYSASSEMLGQPGQRRL